MNKIMTVYAISAPDASRIEDVKKEIALNGSPVVRVIHCGDHYRAIEGCTRLAACADLGILPRFTVIDQDAEIDLATTDLDYKCDFSDRYMLAGDLAWELTSVDNPTYRFQD